MAQKVTQNTCKYSICKLLRVCTIQIKPTILSKNACKKLFHWPTKANVINQSNYIKKNTITENSPNSNPFQRKIVLKISTKTISNKWRHPKKTCKKYKTVWVLKWPKPEYILHIYRERERKKWESRPEVTT